MTDGTILNSESVIERMMYHFVLPPRNVKSKLPRKVSRDDLPR